VLWILVPVDQAAFGGQLARLPGRSAPLGRKTPGVNQVEHPVLVGVGGGQRAVDDRHGDPQLALNLAGEGRAIHHGLQTGVAGRLDWQVGATADQFLKQRLQVTARIRHGDGPRRCQDNLVRPRFDEVAQIVQRPEAPGFHPQSPAQEELYRGHAAPCTFAITGSRPFAYLLFASLPVR